MDNEILPEDSLATKEITVLEGMNKMLESNTDAVELAKIDTPVEAVEKKLSDFITDAFKATNRDFAFNEQLKDELLRRMPNMTDNQFIALYSNNAVNINDRVSKLIAPTISMMQAKQQAEIAAAKAQAQNQIIVAPNAQGGSTINALDPTVPSDALAGMDQFTKLLSALGASQAVDNLPNVDNQPQS